MEVKGTVYVVIVKSQQHKSRQKIFLGALFLPNLQVFILFYFLDGINISDSKNYMDGL